MVRLRGGILVVLALAACSSDDESTDTLDPLNSGSDVTATLDAATSATEAIATGTVAGSPPAATAPAEAAGEGWVRIDVRLAATGQSDTLALDRAMIPADDLDPISLFTTCTALDGGAGYVVAVTDLRRLTTVATFVSAALTVEGEVEEPGEYQATLDLSDATQTSTSYTGTLVVEDGMSSGTFDVADDQGRAATGSFTCAPQPVVESTTTAVRATTPPGGEESGTSAPATTGGTPSTTATTAP